MPADAGDGPAKPKLGAAGGGTGRLGGTAIGGAALGRGVNVSVLTGGAATESPADGSSGASLETQKRPWQRGQLA
jgi:hypothetical protein